MKKVLIGIAIAIGALVGIVIIIAVGLILFGQVSFKRTIANRPLYPITADTSPEGLARGKYLMEEAMLCAEACHSPEETPFTGGVEEVNEGPIAFTFAPPNLTPDDETGLGSWSDAEIARALREGVDKDGKELVIMPAYTYRALSDADVAAIIGYLRNLEPVHNEIPPVNGNAVAKVMLALGMFGPNPVGDPIEEAQTTPASGTVENGEYMVALGGCVDCHQTNLAGGALPFSDPEDVPAANLTPAGELQNWTVEDFIQAVREGVHPEGRTLDEGMPRYHTSDEDLADIFAYLKTIPAATN